MELTRRRWFAVLASIIVAPCVKLGAATRRIAHKVPWPPRFPHFPFLESCLDKALDQMEKDGFDPAVKSYTEAQIAEIEQLSFPRFTREEILQGRRDIDRLNRGGEYNPWTGRVMEPGLPIPEEDRKNWLRAHGFKE